MPAKAEKAGKPARTARGPADRSGGRSYARALDNSAPAGAARYGANASAYRLRLAASSALLKSLRRHPEPPGSLRSPCAGPNPRREPGRAAARPYEACLRNPSSISATTFCLARGS